MLKKIKKLSSTKNRKSQTENSILIDNIKFNKGKNSMVQKY
jgi:hypothetical protein